MVGLVRNDHVVTATSHLHPASIPASHLHNITSQRPPPPVPPESHAAIADYREHIAYAHALRPFGAVCTISHISRCSLISPTATGYGGGLSAWPPATCASVGNWPLRYHAFINPSPLNRVEDEAVDQRSGVDNPCAGMEAEQ